MPPGEVRSVARTTGAIPYDVPDVELSHVGIRPGRSGTGRSRADRPRGRHCMLGSGAAVGRIIGDLPRVVPTVRRRSRDAATRHGGLRRALCQEQACPGRAPHLEPGRAPREIAMKIARQPAAFMFAVALLVSTLPTRSSGLQDDERESSPMPPAPATCAELAALGDTIDLASREIGALKQPIRRRFYPATP